MLENKQNSSIKDKVKNARLYLRKLSFYSKLRIITLIFVLATLGYVFFYLYTLVFSPNTSFKEKEKVIYIKSGSKKQKVYELLSPLLKNFKSFTTFSRYKKYPNQIKAGRFIIKKAMNNRSIIQALVFKNRPIKVTFENIETLERLAGRIAKYIETDSLTLLSTFKDSVFLKKNKFTKEQALGMYISNTYGFFWNSSAEEFQRRMFIEYNRFWNLERLEKLKDLGLSKTEVITLASIVNKESNKVSEWKKIAGVYINRIRKRIPLQACPTVIYALKKKKNDFNLIINRVLYKDLKIKSMYNTYTHRDLPPGPLSTVNPKIIDAILDYEKHNYLYFIADVENFGQHIFSKSLKTHNRHKRNYTRWLRERKIKR